MTLNTKVWHVNEYQVMDLDEVSYGQFHTGDTYVVRWQYMIMQTGECFLGYVMFLRADHSFAVEQLLLRCHIYILHM